MTALTDYLASPDCRDEVRDLQKLRLVEPNALFLVVADAALNALCEQLHEAEAERDASGHFAAMEMNRLLARIRELEQFIARQSEIVDETKAACEETLRQAAEKGRELEAEVERVRVARDGQYRRASRLEGECTDLEVDVERLRVCGTCGHHAYDNMDDGRQFERCRAVRGVVLVDCYDACHFDESLWTPYWADEQAAKPCPHTHHTYRNHGGTRVCADCGEMLEDA